MEYVNQFNHLAQYTGSQVDTDDKKKDRFFRGLTPALQEKLYLGNYQTFGAMMNVAIAVEVFQRASQVDWKRKRGDAGSSSHPTLRRFRLFGGGPINHLAGLRSGRLNRHRRLPPLSTVHLRSRCSHNNLRDSRSHLVKGLGTGRGLVSNVAKMATMPGPVPRTSPLSQPNLPRILGLSRGLSSKRKCPAGPAK